MGIYLSYKANPASVVTTVVDEATGEEKKRLINRMRWKGFGPIAINFSDKGVNIALIYVNTSAGQIMFYPRYQINRRRLLKNNEARLTRRF